jgi:hypothetical protein
MWQEMLLQQAQPPSRKRKAPAPKALPAPVKRSRQTQPKQKVLPKQKAPPKQKVLPKQKALPKQTQKSKQPPKVQPQRQSKAAPVKAPPPRTQYIAHATPARAQPSAKPQRFGNAFSQIFPGRHS